MSRPEPFVYAGLPRALPAGYAAAPVFPTETGAVRLCVVVRTGDRKPGDSGPFVNLRDTVDARVVLGCLADRAGRIHKWVEVWVQDLSGLGQALSSYREVVNNKVMDDRWAARWKAADRLDGSAGAILSTGYETTNPPPVFIDVKKAAPVPARDTRTNGQWALCTDEALLARKGVAPYGSTLARHLYQPEMGDTSDVVPVDMLGNDGQALGLGSAAALNPGGGLMGVQAFAPLAYEEYVDALAGGPSDAAPDDGLLKTISATANGMTGGTVAGSGPHVGSPSGGWLMLGGSGVAGRLVESLHLKLMALSGAASAIRSAVLASQTPMLNVAADSFRVKPGEGNGALPLWWSSRVNLVRPGEAAQLSIPGTDATYFLAGRAGMLSIYAPAGVGQQVEGKGWLRLRNVISDDPAGVIYEGTLTSQERIIPGKNDLLGLRFGLGPLRIDQYATVDAKGSMAPGEIRIRTIPQRYKDDVAARLKQALGVPIPEVHFGVLPLLSSPCDLYALGVLGVRTLLVSKQSPLPVALDELMSLANLVAKDAASGDDLPTRLEKAFANEKRWAQNLGPQLLAAECSSAEEAFAVIPPSVWMGTLAAIIRCFTGLGPDSRCRDFGDAPPGGLQKVFDGLLDDLYALLTACRTLIVSDYALNAEIRSVVKDCMSQVR